MKKSILLFVLILSAVMASAQETVAFKYGRISYNKVLKQMPEYLAIDGEMAKLKAKYDAETKTSEDEFNAKYETFLSEQRSYAPSILRKRQSELEDMMRRNEQFRIDSQRLLQQAREDMENSAKEKLNDAINKIATDNGLAFVLNTDGEGVPFVNPAMSYDITEAVASMLQ